MSLKKNILQTILILILYEYSVSTEQIPLDGDKQLKMVHVVWRHGERNPVYLIPGDPYDETFWDGWGGLGQLTTKGMAEQVSLGDKLRKRYIEDGPFLSSHYNAAEIYLRSTDVNRTLLSAISNMIGMYGQGMGKPGVDYPTEFDNKDLKWPGAFVPVAVHTVDEDTDYALNINSHCPRRKAIWNYVAENSPTIQKVKNDPVTLEIQELIKNNTGVLFPFDLLWAPEGLWQIEIDNNLTMPDWLSSPFMEKLKNVTDLLTDFDNGVGLNLSPRNGIDFSVELVKICGGVLMNEISSRMDQKLRCEGSREKECSWINKLKYYAYSAHDLTISSLLTAFGASSVAGRGLPGYAATAIVELWTDTKTDKDYFKLVYSNGAGEDFRIVTDRVTGCENATTYCDIDVFRNIANIYNPGNAREYCQNVDIIGGTTTITESKTATRTDFFTQITLLICAISINFY